MVADKMRRVDPIREKARAALADMDGRAFAGLPDEFLKRRQHDAVERKRRGINAVQTGHFAAQGLSAIRQLLHQARVL